MQISDFDYDKFNDWYKENIPAYKCEICTSNSAQENVLMPPNVFGLRSLDNSCTYPVVVFGCMGCGHAKLFSAVTLEQMGCPIFHFLPKKSNILKFLDYFKRKKK
jgi:hypothetical protein